MKALAACLSLAFACPIVAAPTVRLASPDRSWVATVTAQPVLAIDLTDADGALAIRQEIGLVLENGTIPAAGTTITKHEGRSIDTKVTAPVRQKAAELTDRFREESIAFSDGTSIIVRLYDDGLAYRFVTDKPGTVTVLSEKRLCRFDGDPLVYFGAEDKGFFSHTEVVYEPTRLSQLKHGRLASLPMTIERQADKGLLVLSESALEAYPGQWIEAADKALTGVQPAFPKRVELKSDRDALPVEREKFIARVEGKRALPWRTVATARRHADLLVNMLNWLVAEPSRIADTSWIQPGKVAWDWWHDWNWEGKKLPMNNDTYRQYIDFAADYGIPFVILDDGWYKLGDLTSPVPGIDVPALVAYGREKKVGIILWAASATLKDQFDTAMALFEKWGVKGLKVDFFQRDDQPEVEFYWKLSADAAKRRLTLDFHGAHKPAGLQRTFPNVLNIEGLKGLENCKWSKLITPTHDTTLPFTRMVAGPLDYTPGAMRNLPVDRFEISNSSPASMGTRCHELAKYVIYDAPLQMLCDAPPHYRREAKTMEFLKEVPAVWDDSIALDGRIGQFAVMARRSGNRWFLGGLANEQARNFKLENMTFLDKGLWQATIWRDTPESATKATDFTVETIQLDPRGTTEIKSAPGGGFVAILTKTAGP